jgi:hypothetical protein
VVLRHLLSIAILPFTVAVLIPLRIAQNYAIAPGIAPAPSLVALQIAGAALGAVGRTPCGPPCSSR